MLKIISLFILFSRYLSICILFSLYFNILTFAASPITLSENTKMTFIENAKITLASQGIIYEECFIHVNGEECEPSCITENQEFELILPTTNITLFSGENTGIGIVPFSMTSMLPWNPTQGELNGTKLSTLISGSGVIWSGSPFLIDIMGNVYFSPSVTLARPNNNMWNPVFYVSPGHTSTLLNELNINVNNNNVELKGIVNSYSSFRFLYRKHAGINPHIETIPNFTVTRNILLSDFIEIWRNMSVTAKNSWLSGNIQKPEFDALLLSSIPSFETYFMDLNISDSNISVQNIQDSFGQNSSIIIKDSITDIPLTTILKSTISTLSIMDINEINKFLETTDIDILVSSILETYEDLDLALHIINTSLNSYLNLPTDLFNSWKHFSFDEEFFVLNSGISFIKYSEFIENIKIELTLLKLGNITSDTATFPPNNATDEDWLSFYTNMWNMVHNVIINTTSPEFFWEMYSKLPQTDNVYWSRIFPIFELISFQDFPANNEELRTNLLWIIFKYVSSIETKRNPHLTALNNPSIFNRVIQLTGSRYVVGSIIPHTNIGTEKEYDVEGINLIPPFIWTENSLPSSGSLSEDTLTLFNIANKNLSNSIVSTDITNRLSSIRNRLAFFTSATLSGENIPELSLSPIMNLTLDRTDSIFSPPIHSTISGTFPSNITSPTNYVLLLSTLQEMFYLRRYFQNVFISAFTGDNSVTSAEEFIVWQESSSNSNDNILILSQLQNFATYFQAISFLMSNPAPIDGLSSLSKVRGLMSMQEWGEYLWLEPLYDSNEISLSDIYVILLNSGVDFSNLLSHSFDPTTKPLGHFFSDRSINNYLRLGIIQSSTFIPLRTNVNNPTSYFTLAEENSEFIQFHEIWGNYRKAIFIDTDSRAVQNWYTTSRRGNLRVATLRDVIGAHGDVLLFSDNSFYNVHDLAEMQGRAFNHLDVGENSDQSTANPLARLWNNIRDFFILDVRELTRTGNHERYSIRLRGITQFGASLVAETGTHRYDGAVLWGDVIQELLNWEITDPTEYSPMRSFAVVSAIYRDTSLLNYLNNQGRQPIFVSSQFLATEQRNSWLEFNALINHSLLRNLSAMRTLSFETNLDLDSPLFLDIYGNIITESGLVVISAASNATLQKEYNIFNSGFLSTYGREYSIPSNITLPQGLLSQRPSWADFFNNENENSKFYEIQPFTLNNAVNLTQVSYADKNVMNVMRSLFSSQFSTMGTTSLNKERFDFDVYVSQILMEVMRGSPLTHLDFDVNGINPNRRLSVGGIVAAYQLEELMTTLRGTSTGFLNIPNPAFLPGVEYILFFVYRILVLGAIALVIFKVVVTATQGRSFLSVIGYIGATIVVLVSMLYIVPKTFELSYYSANKLFLQDETRKILMFNLERREQGIELGMTAVHPPTEDSSILLKLREIDIPWHILFRDIITANSATTLSSIYTYHTSKDLASVEESFFTLNNGIYIDVFDLFDASSVNVNPRLHILTHRTSSNTPASFFTPYYLFLDILVQNVNMYNLNENMASYTYSIYRGGRIKSVGIIEAYLLSERFHSSIDFDFLGLRTIYGRSNGLLINSLINDGDFNSYEDTTSVSLLNASLVNSQWWNENIEIDDVDLENRIRKVEKYAIDYVASTGHLIGRVSDETYLRLMALSISMFYNKVFNIGVADTFELYNMCPEDLIRVSVANERTVMEGAPFTFGRYMYSLGSQGTVYFSALLMIVMYISAWLKAVLVLILFFLIFISLFVYKLVLNKEERSLQGYVFLIVLISLLNFFTAGIFKITMLLPATGLSPMIIMLIMTLLQLLILTIYINLVCVVAKNWKDLGAMTFKDMTETIITKIKEISKDVPDNGWIEYEKIKLEDEKRIHFYNNKNPFD